MEEIPSLFYYSLVILVALLISFIFIHSSKACKKILVQSDVDGRKYRVYYTYNNYKQASDHLAQINWRIHHLLVFLNHNRNLYSKDQIAIINRLCTRYNPSNLTENDPTEDKKESSYTLDKGAVIAICLRQKNNKNILHDLDTLTFVTLHELTHVGIQEHGHPPYFITAFSFLLGEAEKAGILNSPNFALSPLLYCGVWITYNPRWDPQIFHATKTKKTINYNGASARHEVAFLLK